MRRKRLSIVMHANLHRDKFSERLSSMSEDMAETWREGCTELQDEAVQDAKDTPIGVGGRLELINNPCRDLGTDLVGLEKVTGYAVNGKP